jgi:hypothetical protein
MLPTSVWQKRRADQRPQVFEAGGKMRQQKATWQSNLLKVFAHQLFLSLSGMERALPQALFFMMKDVKHHTEQAPYQNL